MPIDTPDVEELIELLRSNPELRRKVFVALAPDEFLTLPAKVERLAEQFAEHFTRIESLLERQAQEFVAYHTYLGKVMRRVRLLSPPDIEEQLRQALTGDELVDIFSADIIARGRPLHTPDRDIYLVMEVSMVVDVSDVARARRRAELMRKAGYPCMAAVGGHDITEEAKLEAQHSNVLCALDGNLHGWDSAQGQAIAWGSV